MIGRSIPHQRARRWAGRVLGITLLCGLVVGAFFGHAALGASVGVVVGALLEMASWRGRASD